MDRGSDPEDQEAARQRTWHLVQASRYNWTCCTLNRAGLGNTGHLRVVESWNTVGFSFKIQATLRHRATCERKGKRQTATTAAVAFLAGWPSLLSVSRLPKAQRRGGVAPQPPLLQLAIRRSKSKRRGWVEFAGRIPLPLPAAAVGRDEPGAPTATPSPFSFLAAGGVPHTAWIGSRVWFAWHCHRLALPGATAHCPARGAGEPELAGGRVRGRGAVRWGGAAGWRRAGRGGVRTGDERGAASCVVPLLPRMPHRARHGAGRGGGGWIGGVMRGEGAGMDFGGGGVGDGTDPPLHSLPPPRRLVSGGARASMAAMALGGGRLV